MADKQPSPLTAAQREIMQIVWDRGEVTVSEVRNALAPRRRIARNTVQTMMVRLDQRGWLKHRESGRTFFYSASVSRKTSMGARVGQLVDRFFAGSAEDMVAALVEYRGLTREEAARIREMIDSAEIKNATKKQSSR